MPRTNDDECFPGTTYKKRSPFSWWLLTIPFADFEQPESLPAGLLYVTGQQEVWHFDSFQIGEQNGYHHWQLVMRVKGKQRLSWLKARWPTCHAEPTLSDKARNYVTKDFTAVAGTRFELGELPVRRNEAIDWTQVKGCAVAGNLHDIPDQIYVTHYSSLRRIMVDNMDPPLREGIVVKVFIGPTQCGKSHRAREEALSFGKFYKKIPTTKFWDGYKGEENVIIDEFRGAIDIAHLLQWFDKFECHVENKGAGYPLRAIRFWVTSNLTVSQWYPNVDDETMAALRRRIQVTTFHVMEEFDRT